MVGMQPKSWLFQLLFAAPHVILLCQIKVAANKRILKSGIIRAPLKVAVLAAEASPPYRWAGK